MLYTREIVNEITKDLKKELKRTIFIIVLNNKNEMTREGKFISLNKRYIKIKNRKHGIHKIAISDISNISILVI